MRLIKNVFLTCMIAISATASASTIERDDGRAPLEVRYVSLDYRAIEEAREEAEQEMLLQYGDEEMIEAAYVAASNHSSTHKGSYHTYSGVSAYADQIELEDGSLWFVLPAERTKILDWVLGDSLAILKGDSHSNYRYRIHNERTNHIVDVEFSAFPYLDSFYRLTIQDINKEQRYVLLSDGSKWTLPTNWFEQEVWMKWYIGDTIIIGTNDQFFYSLFRPDILINVTCSATYTPSKCVN